MRTSHIICAAIIGAVIGIALRADTLPCSGPLCQARVISDKTQAVIWKSQARINRLQAQLDAEIAVRKDAVQQANAECGEGWHVQQDAKEDLTCAENPKPKE